MKRSYVYIANGSFPEPTAEELRVAEKKAGEARARIFQEFPELRVELRDVPPEKNGISAIYLLAEDRQLEALGNGGILDQVDASLADFNAEEIQAKLEEHRAIGARIETIAAMPSRSLSGIPENVDRFLPSQSIKWTSEYLLLRCRLAVETGDEDEAYRFLELAIHLGQHISESECVTFLSETISILRDLNSRSVFFKSILPKLRSDTDLSRWDALLESPGYGAARYSKMLVGEWHYFSDEWLRLTFIPTSDYGIPDPEMMAGEYAAWVSKNLSVLPTYAADEFAKNGSLPFDATGSNLSKEGLDTLRIIQSGKGAWEKGYIRSMIAFAQFDAAMDIVVRDQGGEDLSGLTKTYLVDPVLKLPFEFDPVTRSISVASSLNEYEVQSLVLPKW